MILEFLQHRLSDGKRLRRSGQKTQSISSFDLMDKIDWIF